MRQLEEQKSAFLPFPVFVKSSFPHCWQQELLLLPITILFLLQYILMESLLSPVISAIREKLFPFFLSRSILFLSSFVTVMYSLESYEGLALHLFKEFRDGEFREVMRKSERSFEITRAFCEVRQEALLIHMDNVIYFLFIRNNKSNSIAFGTSSLTRTLSWWRHSPLPIIYL